MRTADLTDSCRCNSTERPHEWLTASDRGLLDYVVSRLTYRRKSRTITVDKCIYHPELRMRSYSQAKRLQRRPIRQHKDDKVWKWRVFWAFAFKTAIHHRTEYECNGVRSFAPLPVKFSPVTCPPPGQTPTRSPARPRSRARSVASPSLTWVGYGQDPASWVG